MKKIFTAVFLAAMALFPSFLNAQNSSDGEYVDLGLPSGTKWKSHNESGFHITYDEAIEKYGNNLPNQDQWEELRIKCDWTWTKIGYYIISEDSIDMMGYRVVGPNGNFIDLPAGGFGTKSASIGASEWGYYCVYPTQEYKDFVVFLFFNSECISELMGNKSTCYSVHLVQNKK